MSRRGQGEGSIFQLPSGRWRAMVDLGYINGRRCRKAKTCRTRAEAAGWLRAALRDHERGALVSRTPTVAEWLDTYLTNARSNNKVRPGTLDNYQRCAELHIKPVLGLVKLDALTPQRLSQFYATKMQQGTSAWTVRYVHAVLRRALKVAMRWGVIARNVATLVEPPPEPEHEVEPLTVTEARAFLAAAQHDRLEARWVVGLSLGLRQGETLGLRWDDIDFARRQLYVRRQLVRARAPATDWRSRR